MPGVILQLTYTISTSLTGSKSIVERKEGLTDRVFASGVTEVLLMFSLMIVQFIIMTGGWWSFLLTSPEVKTNQMSKLTIQVLYIKLSIKTFLKVLMKFLNET